MKRKKKLENDDDESKEAPKSSMDKLMKHTMKNMKNLCNLDRQQMSSAILFKTKSCFEVLEKQEEQRK